MKERMNNVGYRQYFYEVDKAIVDGIRRCQTNQELYEFCLNHHIECEKDDDEDEVTYSCPPYHYGREIFGFGKGYENAAEIIKHGEPLFTTEILAKRYEEYRPVVCTREAILCAIKWQKNAIVEIYEDLLREQSSDRFDERSQLDRLREHAETYLTWWKHPYLPKATPYNLNDNTDALVRSWLYEHTIFDLVRIYKTFDFENKALLFCGW